MRNQLRQYYCALGGLPGLGRRAAWRLSGVHHVAEKLLARSGASLRARRKNLENQCATFVASNIFPFHTSLAETAYAGLTVVSVAGSLIARSRS